MWEDCRGRHGTEGEGGGCGHDERGVQAYCHCGDGIEADRGADRRGDFGGG